MYEIVTVTKILSSEMLEVSCTSSACNGCKGEAFCNTKGKRFEAWNKTRLASAGWGSDLICRPNHSGDAYNAHFGPSCRLLSLADGGFFRRHPLRHSPPSDWDFSLSGPIFGLHRNATSIVEQILSE